MTDLKNRISLALHVLKGKPLMYKIDVVDGSISVSSLTSTKINGCTFKSSGIVFDTHKDDSWNDDEEFLPCDHAGCFHNEQELPGMWENADFIDNSEQDVKQPLSVPLWAFGLAEDPEDSWEDSNETESEYILRRTENVLVTKANKGYIWKNLDYEED